MADPAVWGDVATWVTGAATIATFGLGYRILRGDRKRAERSQAAKISIFPAVEISDEFKADAKGEYLESILRMSVDLWNHSDQPIFEVGLTLPDFPSMPRWFTRDSEEDSAHPTTVLPGEHVSTVVPDIGPDLGRYYVLFEDSAGLDWKFRLSDKRLTRLKFKISKHSTGNQPKIRWDRLPILDD